MEIARKYLIPQVLDMTGLKAGNISLSDEALSLLIKLIDLFFHPFLLILEILFSS